MRPHPDVVEVLKRELDIENADMLLLGVTPELARLGRTMIAVDAGPHMIGALWIGDTPTRKAVVGNWLDLPIPDDSIDVVVGDGCLCVVTGAAQRLRVIEEVARVLRPGGRAGIKLFARPDTPESFEDIKSDVMAGNVKELTELVLRVGLWLPAEPPDYARKFNDVLDTINEMFPDRKSLVALTGWNPEVFRFIDLYEGSDTVGTWPGEARSIEEASRYFGDVRLVPSGAYRASDRCPIMVLRDPKR